MIGETADREIVDWKRLDDGDGDDPVYVIEYSEPISAPVVRRPPRFSASGGGTVPAGEQLVLLPDGERVPPVELFFECDGRTLRVRRGDPSVVTRFWRWIVRSW